MEEQKTLTHTSVMKAMDWAYDKAVNGISKFDSAETMANDFLKGSGTLRDKANRLIRWQNTKAGTAGFVLGLGGAITLPATIPLNITSVLYVQIRMIAAIAKMGGHNLHDDRVKSLVFCCLVSTSVNDVVKQTGIKIGEHLAKNAIKNISKETIKTINKKVGFRLLTKFGEKGVVNFGKLLPLIGGVVGGLFDGISTNIIGNVARDTFIPERKSKVESQIEEIQNLVQQ